MNLTDEQQKALKEVQLALLNFDKAFGESKGWTGSFEKWFNTYHENTGGLPMKIKRIILE